MSLNIFDLPTLPRFRVANWRRTGGVIYSRSEFTGRTQSLRIGPSARWSCQLTQVPTNDPAIIDETRFLMAAFSTGNTVARVRFFDTAQTATVSCLTNGTNQLGFTIAVDGLPASQTILRRGSIVTLLFGADEQSCVLLADLVSNGSGQGSLALDAPVRQAVADNTTVLLANPQCLMRLRDGLGWTLQPAAINDFDALDFEEAF